MSSNGNPSEFLTLGDRMKAHEEVHRQVLPARTYTILRIDGRASHSYTRDLQRPYDLQFMSDMDTTAVEVLKEIQGARFAYVQSDEISILATDFTKADSQAWFGGVVPKIVSISAATATAAFNELRPGKRALFDSRVFTLQNKQDVAEYFRWRQLDTRRNSIMSLGRALYSKRELHGMKSFEVIRRARDEHDIDWETALPAGFRQGRIILPEQRLETVSYIDGRTNQSHTTDVLRSHWEPKPAFQFGADDPDQDELLRLIPDHPDSTSVNIAE